MIRSESQFIPVKITNEMRANAIKTAEEYKDNLTNSIRKGRGTYAGCLGEEMFHATFPFMERVNDFQYDFAYRKLKFDLKTKERTVAPKIYYDCSVNTMNGKQDCDYYIFAQVLNTYDFGWLLGVKKTSEYFAEASLHPKGSRDERNNFEFHCDTYNVPISQLRPLVLNK